MPTVVFANPKGGVGKSTSAVLLSTMLAEHGATVAMIDADPNKPISAWASRAPIPQKLHVISENVTEETISDLIDDEATKSQFVVVDCEGTASTTVAYAMSRANLVVIPTQGSPLDAIEAVKLIQLIKRTERAFKVSIPFVVVFTRTSAAIHPRSLSAIEAEFAQHGMPMLGTQIHERDAFRAMFSFGGTVTDLDGRSVSNVKGARKNAWDFTKEIMEIIVRQEAERSSRAGAKSAEVA